MRLELGGASTPEEAAVAGEAWARSMDPSRGVGAVHHIVPKFILRGFSDRDRICRRAPGEATTRRVHIDELGVKNFYTAVSEGSLDEPAGPVDGSAPERYLDASLEQALSQVEGSAAEVIRRIALEPARAVSLDEREALAIFLSFQFVRGYRHRREVEMMSEYWAKTMYSQGSVPEKLRREAERREARRAGKVVSRGNGGWKQHRPHDEHRLPESELRTLGVATHPNEHLKLIGQSAQIVFRELMSRPVMMVEFDEPYLLICDEPVVVWDGAEREHLPGCAMTDRDRARLRKKAMLAGRDFQDTVHIYRTRPSGVAVAEEIVFPIDPARLLVLGPKHQQGDSHVQLLGDEARETAGEVNARLAAQAYLWVAGHPDNPAINVIDLPPIGPLFKVCDGASAARDCLAAAPNPVRAVRVRPRDLQR